MKKANYLTSFFSRVNISRSQDCLDNNPHYSEWMKYHQQKYRCEMCGRPSSGPTTYKTIAVEFDILPIQDLGNEELLLDNDWDSPKDLYICHRCGLYYCSLHKNCITNMGCTHCL